MRAIFLLLAGALPLCAQTFEVIHKKPLWPDGRGKIRITEEAIEFNAQEDKNRHRWTYEDIQHFDRISKTEFSILTYEDQKWKFGLDRKYHFVLVSGELTDEVFASIRRRIRLPVTDRVVEPAKQNTIYELPVKHLHTFGGCEGTLGFTDEKLYFTTEHRKDAREWRMAQEVESVWSMDPYRLEVHTYENLRRDFSGARIYKFALKEPLDQEFFRRLKLKLYKLDTKNRAGQ